LIDLPLATCPGPQGHRRATLAGGKPRQQDRSGDDTRRDHLGTPARKRLLDAFEHVPVDDRLDHAMNMLVGRLLAQRARAATVERCLTDIGPVGQDRMDGGDAEEPSALGPIAMSAQPGRDGLDAHRPSATIAVAIEREDPSDQFGLDGIDDQDLLVAVAVPGDDLGREPKRNGRAVIVAQAGVLLHHALDMFAVLARLVFVEERGYLPVQRT
jgi:hypothetical protein